MAAKVQPKLSFMDIVTRADANTIREALEARVKIDDLLVIREEAYKKIFDIESEIEGIVGEEGTFDFGETPYPVAGLTKKKARPKPKPKPKAEVPAEDSTDESDEKSEDAKDSKK
ncbi:MAG: hypothetical protein NE327_17635 [Lentisphaeraceae bacterium]|nr:hypothetical protein [Lentisphaeraceae bacterium]